MVQELINQHATMDENFSWSSDDASKDKHYEEYQAFVLETYYSLIQKRKDIPVSFVWNMFDFSCYRNEGGIPRRNTKGLVCYDHTTKKMHSISIKQIGINKINLYI